ncbi:nuclear transport factor 2 family protein [Litorivivens sp.]|uniref:nuclear transport factor 2 family protein n=1 Tax=Litorivivens sp. TaxID=2020868 RepID=UPI003566561B
MTSQQHNAQSANSLEQRIARLEAIEAIKQLKYRYFFHCDQKQPEAVRACFADGPVRIEYGRVGNFDSADEMVAIFAKLACAEHIVEMHHAQNPQIELLSDTSARAIWGIFYYLIDTQQQITTQLGGFYEDEYRCDAGEWKITATRFNVKSTQILALSDDRVQAVFAGAQAPAELDDPNKQAG